jgi:hypothetical protein
LCFGATGLPVDEEWSVIMNRKVPENLGMLLLAVWLILLGVLTAPVLSFGFAHSGDVLAVLGVAAGVPPLLQRQAGCLFGVLHASGKRADQQRQHVGQRQGTRTGSDVRIECGPPSPRTYFTAPGNRTSFSNEQIARSASSSP